MKISINISHKYWKWNLFLSIILLWNTSFAQTYSSRAYATGNFIFCGKELPKKFSYLIEKQSSSGQWTSVAELAAPTNLADCKARMMSLPSSVSSITQIQTAVTEFIWQRINKPNSTLDTLFAYGSDPRYQYVAGTAWFDEDVKKAGTYKYRISHLGRTGETTFPTEVSVTFPTSKLNAKAIPLRYKLNLSNIAVSYDIATNKDVVGLKLFRGIYLQKNYKEISPEMMFTSEKGKMVAQLTDNDVTNGFTYSYVAIPYDGLGNFGTPSDTVNVYFVTKPADIGMVTDFTVTPNMEKAGNLLKWSYRKSAYVNLVEIYRSVSYNGTYKKIASLGSNQTEYFDNSSIQPTVTYFYYIIINNGIGNSLPSARVPAILQGNKQNVIPPQDLTLTKKGNIVTLNFRRVGKDVRGYYVYRADGYDAELQQLPRMLLSISDELTYNDTLPASVNSSIYSYAVASINTSYNISPMSNRVNTSYSGGRLPVPSNLDGKYADNKVMLMWNDVSSLNNTISSYQIFRKTVLNNKKEKSEELIANVEFATNYFEDTSVLPGRDYIYRVRCVASDTTDVSSLSLPFSVYAPADAIMPAGEISAVSAENKILLRWTLPMVENIESVNIYRAPENGKEMLLKTLSSSSEKFEDTTVQRGMMYYYFITIKYKNGLESKPTDAVSAKWN